LKGASSGNIDIVRALLQASAHMNHQDMNGNTALWDGIIDSFY
jgi:ankyrin repeat protein